MRITKIGIPPGGDINQVLVKSSGTDYDVEWGTGSGTATPPGGTNTQVQFNDGGVFGGDAGFTYNKTTNRLTLGSLVLNDVVDPGVDTDKFLVLTSLGVVSYRTGSEVLADIGLTNPVTGTGSSGQVAYWNGTNTITGESNLFWDASNDRLGIGTSTPTAKLQVQGDSIINTVNIGIGGGSINSNTIVGTNSLKDNTTGYNNTAFGQLSLRSNVDGYENTAVGWASLYSNSDGYNNTSIGSGALFKCVSSFENTAVGFVSLSNNSLGYGNSALGSYSLYTNTTGYFNTAFGYNSIGSANTTGYQNTAVGGYSLSINTTGNQNTAIGANAGWIISNNGNTTGSNNIFIGYQSIGVSSTESNRTWIGNSSTTSTWLGGNLILGTTTNSGFRLDVNGTARIQDNLTISDAKNVILGTTTGTKIGTATTQKIGFFNATPVVQPSAVTSAQGIADALTSLGLLASSTISGGGSTYSISTKTTTYTETATSGEIILLGDTTTAGFTITLPTAVSNTAKITIKKIAGANNLTIDANGSETIDGGLTAVLVRVYESITLVSDNSNWHII